MITRYRVSTRPQVCITITDVMGLITICRASAKVSDIFHCDRCEKLGLKVYGIRQVSRVYYCERCEEFDLEVYGISARYQVCISVTGVKTLTTKSSVSARLKRPPWTPSSALCWTAR